MTTIEVIVNGKAHRTIGLGAPGALSALISLVRQATSSGKRGTSASAEMRLELGATESPNSGPSHILKWNNCDLKPGDEILFRIRDAGVRDEPDSISREDPEKAKAQKRRYFEILKAELGEK